LGIEFVKDKITKEAFSRKLDVSNEICKLALSSPYNIAIYPGTGCVNGYLGDHIFISPAYTINKKQADLIIVRVSAVIEDFFF
jgi:adenosylmethionine-8-amino-7-oxononanoate aminotransferase